MGHEVETVLQMRGHELASIVDPLGVSGAGAGSPSAMVHTSVSADSLRNCDVAIEFSVPDAVQTNVAGYADAGCPAVIGTTGWYDRMDDVTSPVRDSGIGLLYGSNFSIGAHLFLEIARHAASLVAEIEEYDLQIHEVHHRRKKDSPSGTALTLARLVMDAVPRKTKMETNRLDQEPGTDTLHVSSSRVGWVPGTHTLTLDSAADTIEVRHQARNRSGFALGAVLAAEWIVGRKGLHTVEEFAAALMHQ